MPTMTTEERLNRIEHLTANLAEERRKDREEYKTLWRDTQRQINQLTEFAHDFALDTRTRFDKLDEKIEQFAAESRAADKQLGERIESLVSAIGQFISRQ